jgi:outer membrane protein assembly factor BamB
MPRFLTAALAALAMLISASAASAATVPGCADPAPGGHWPFYSGTVDGHRSQTAPTALSKDNVAQLALAWKVPMPDGSKIQSTPVEADGCVFTGTSTGVVLAVNAETGKTIWTKSFADVPAGNAFEGAGLVGAPAVVDGLVHVPLTTATGAVMTALDEATGEEVWTQVLDTDDGSGLDSSPVPFDGMIFQAFKGDESSNHSNPGWVILDAATGEVLVKQHLLPAEDYAAGYRGGSTIGTPAVDLEHKLLYAGTGNPASPKQHPLTNSQLKIDVDRESPTFGKVLGSHRGTSDSYPFPQDVDSPVCQTELQWPAGRFSCFQFDYNFLASPNLWQHSDGRRLFGQMQKSGVFSTVDAATMEPVWTTTLAQPCLGCNLGSTAVDENGVYAATTNGNLYALDRDTGSVKWVVPLTGSTHFNGVSVANGVVYNLNDLGFLQAFDAATGAPLLAHPFASDTQAVTQDAGNSSGLAIARDSVFVSSQTDAGSTLFAYRLPAASSSSALRRGLLRR